VWNYFCLNSQVVSGKGLGGSNAQIVIVIPIIVGAALMALATARQAAAEPNHHHRQALVTICLAASIAGGPLT